MEFITDDDGNRLVTPSMIESGEITFGELNEVEAGIFNAISGGIAAAGYVHDHAFGDGTYIAHLRGLDEDAAWQLAHDLSAMIISLFENKEELDQMLRDFVNQLDPEFTDG